ncbi:ferredoxin family protein [Saccharothrix isguenensis]
MNERYTGRSLDDVMSTVEFRVGERAHIEVDSDICASCTSQVCVHACPADLFVPTADGGILFNYEHCFECGTCYLVCDSPGAITWTYPDGGQGVVFTKG